MEHGFKMTPEDVLFFRDARPMEASDIGCGANWPRPDQLYHALRSALLLSWPSRQNWEGERGVLRFGSLRTLGPFPQRKGELYLPCPMDWNMRLVKVENTDLPKPLTHSFLPPSTEKVSLPRWIPASAYGKYLAGGALADALKDVSEDALFNADRQIGIGLDARTSTTVEGRFYQAEYLRLGKDVSMAASVSCETVPSNGGKPVDAWQQEGAPTRFPFGGQRRMCRLEKAGAIAFPQAAITTPYLRWTLITPAIFLDGWRPGWVLAEDGQVRLRRSCEPRRTDETRADWKARCKGAPFIKAKLVAARIGKPMAFSGWRVADGKGTNAPKPTVFAVPAGSSYVFACDSVKEAQALAEVLAAPQRRSDLCGEQGFGLGLCSSVMLPNESAN